MVENTNESNSDVLTEKRFYNDYEGKVVTGQIDVYDMSSKILYDVKTVSAWNLVNGYKKSWEFQLNVLADLMVANAWKVKGLAIVAIAREWNASQVSGVETYPKHAITVVDISLWMFFIRKKYLDQQFSRHLKDKHYCTPEERWQS